MGQKISLMAPVGAPLGTDIVEISREVSPGVWQTFSQALGNSQLLGLNEIGFGNGVTGVLTSDPNFSWNGSDFNMVGKQNIFGVFGSNIQEAYTAFLDLAFIIRDDGNINAPGAGFINTNSAFGTDALFSNTAGDRNSAFGSEALSLNSIGVQNSAFGHRALQNNLADGNCAFGRSALQSNTSGTNNNAFGWLALFSNTSGIDNIAIGRQSLFAVNDSQNVAIGSGAGSVLTAGYNNTFVGHGTGNASLTGLQNTFLGAGAGAGVTSGDNNTIIGCNINPGNVSGYVILGDGLSQIRLQFDNAGEMRWNGPPVSAAVAIASTDKIKVNIGGTNYYLLATTIP